MLDNSHFSGRRIFPLLFGILYLKNHKFSNEKRRENKKREEKKRKK
jgi:hypothetical protein